MKTQVIFTEKQIIGTCYLCLAKATIDEMYFVKDDENKTQTICDSCYENFL